MSIPVSSVPTAKAWLFNQLTANIDTAGVTEQSQVVYAQPTTYLAPNIIAVDKVNREVTQAHMVGSGGAGWLREQYTIEVVISCMRGGSDFLSLETDFWALVALVESTVRTDPSLGGAVSVARPTRGDALSAFTDDHNGILCEGTFPIDCLAEL
jgi:hypothetical protein